MIAATGVFVFCFLVALVAPQWEMAAPNSESSVPRCSTPSATALTLMPTLPVAVKASLTATGGGTTVSIAASLPRRSPAANLTAASG